MNLQDKLIKLYNEIDEKCPATILRNKENVKLYLDKDSAKLLTTFL